MKTTSLFAAALLVLAGTGTALAQTVPNTPNPVGSPSMPQSGTNLPGTINNPNGTMNTGTIQNGTLHNGTLNGTPGTMGNGTIHNGTLNGSAPGGTIQNSTIPGTTTPATGTGRTRRMQRTTPNTTAPVRP